jgi:hypothetical protein
MAYIDIFYTWSIFAAVLVPVVLLLIRRVGPMAVIGGGPLKAEQPRRPSPSSLGTTMKKCARNARV